MGKITEETPIGVPYYLMSEIVIRVNCFEEVVHTTLSGIEQPETCGTFLRHS